MAEYIKKPGYISHQVYGSSESLSVPTGDKVEIVGMQVMGLRNPMSIRFGEEYVHGTILVRNDGHTAFPTPIKLRPGWSVTVGYDLGGQSGIFVMYELIIYTEIPGMTALQEPRETVTRQEVERIVEEKIKQMVGDLTDEELGKLMIEIRGQKKDAQVR